MPTPTPDRDYHIDADARARLKRGIGPDALERLLQHLPSESRQSHLEMFSAYLEVDANGRALT
jgi:hypothetical protein